MIRDEEFADLTDGSGVREVVGWGEGEETVEALIRAGQPPSPPRPRSRDARSC